MASISSAERDAYGVERRNSDISLVSNGRPSLPTYENSTDPNLNKENRKPVPLIRSRTVVLLYVSIYAGLAIAGWAILCQATFRPDTNRKGIPAFSTPEYLRSGRILTSLAALLTVPTTSVAFAFAAASYIQYSSRQRNHPTLRQTLALANGDWANPKIVISLATGEFWKRQSSPLLLFAVVLNIIGFLVYPLQQLLVDQETVVTPSSSSTSTRVADISNLYGEGPLGYPDMGEVAITLRSILTSATSEDPQPRLWQSQVANCGYKLAAKTYDPPEDRSWCYSYAGLNSLDLDYYEDYQDPFVAPLRYGFSTGTERNFVPRINSSVTYEEVPADEFAENCSNADDFNFKYYVTEGSIGRGLQACMPGDLTFSPFKNQRDVQHIEETLFLNISSDSYINSKAYKAVMRTTVGYFELPNTMNNQVSGPLLEKFPDVETPEIDTNSDNDYYYYDRPLGLASVPGKGPLAEIAVALFGNGSFFALRENPDYTKVFPGNSGDPERCFEFPPLHNLAAVFQTCNTDSSAFSQVSDWLRSFLDPETMGIRLRNAAVLANDLHLTHKSVTKSLPVSADVGLAYQKPTMSLASMIIISVLLGVYILSLFLLASYAAFQPSWTEKLDAFAMMRVGAALSDRGDLFAVNDRLGKNEVIDKLPGYVGDMQPEDEVGRLGVGAMTPLTRKRKYYASNI
ncbi:hypothetical protein FQN54_001751 [Arachnomyces sp. PD_36]|nr:hypothetical protein FQN54_001751 [Arachnomyces sp. PD_36]